MIRLRLRYCKDFTSLLMIKWSLSESVKKNIQRPREASLNFMFRFERCQSEETRPSSSVWQRFKSYEDTDAVVRRNTVAGFAHQFASAGGAGSTLPRPRATVKPLPAPAPQQKVF